MPLRRIRRPFTQLTDFERGRVVGLREAGWTYRRIARQLDRSDQAVRRCWEQWVRAGTHTRQTGSGRPRSTDSREDRFICRQARTAPTVTTPTIQSQVLSSSGSLVSRQTISRRLAEGGLHSRRPFHVLPLTARHRRLRLQWCRERRTWTAMDWNRIVFSDESRFCLASNDGRVRVWRPSGQRANLSYSVERHTAPTAGVMVWGAITYDRRSSLVVIQGSVTADRYVREILQPHVLPLMAGLPGTIFQQDNARPPTARVSTQCLRQVETLSWPPYSPDLSPIEHIGDPLGRRLHHPTSVRELQAQLQQAWANLPQDNLRNLYASMPDRISSCIRARGGPTRY